MNEAQADETEGTPFERFDRLFRELVTVPKAEVEKEEAKERLRNRTLRTKRKRAQKKA